MQLQGSYNISPTCTCFLTQLQNPNSNVTPHYICSHTLLRPKHTCEAVSRGIGPSSQAPLLPIGPTGVVSTATVCIHTVRSTITTIIVTCAPDSETELYPGIPMITRIVG